MAYAAESNPFVACELDRLLSMDDGKRFAVMPIQFVIHVIVSKA